MAALRTWSPHDAMLGTVAPLALALAAPGPALVIDLDPSARVLAGAMTLAGLVADGPRRTDLSPGRRRGVAVVGNGGVDERDAAEVVSALVAGWPHVVLRSPPSRRPGGEGVVPVIPLGPGPVPEVSPAVYQRGPWPVDRSLRGVVLPRPRAVTIRSLLEGRRPRPSRWLRAWRPVWSSPWP